MSANPTLKQYFGDTEDESSKFFDEIGTTSDMIQSVYLGEPQEAQIPAGFFQENVPDASKNEDIFPNIAQMTNSSVSMPATSLPNPSTFFDTIGPDPHMGLRSDIKNQNKPDVTDGFNNKEQPADKEADRRRDAWLPNEEALKSLIKAQSSPKGSFFPEREVLTMPGLVLEEELADSLQEVCVKYLGVSSAGSRGVVRAEHVTRDETGLRELLRTGHLRAAVNLTGILITAAGQGVGRINKPSKNSARTLQLWLTRFAVLLKIRQYDVLVKEAEAFGNFEKPDMFYQFYPDLFENRTGTLVPFSLRLLIAELPSHIGKPEESLNRLYTMLAVIKKMLINLQENRTEDGSLNVTEQDKNDSIRLWTGRETRVLHSIVNCALALKDYRLADRVLCQLHSGAPGAGGRRALRSARGRAWLLAGNVAEAKACFHAATEERQRICPTPDVREYVDNGLLEIANGKYQEAYNNLTRAADQEPTNIMVANNLAVCLLYMGRLKEAIAVLQKAINSDPERGLNESILINLCTLYELESSKTHEKKLNLLRMLCKYKSDTVPNVVECLKLGQG